MTKKKDVKEMSKPEDKTDKFIRVIQPRVNKALKAIRLLGNCTSSGYKWTDAMSEHVLAELSTELDTLSNKFARRTDKQTNFEFQS